MKSLTVLVLLALVSCICLASPQPGGLPCNPVAIILGKVKEVLSPSGNNPLKCANLNCHDPKCNGCTGNNPPECTNPNCYDPKCNGCTGNNPPKCTDPPKSCS